MIELYFDGSCNPNPGGIIGAGFVAKEQGMEIGSGSKNMEPGKNNTNNVAEYMALILGMDFLIKSEKTKENIIVYGDSLMVIRQMQRMIELSGSRSKRSGKGKYVPWYNMATEKLKLFSNIKFQWIPRESNSEADSLSVNYQYVEQMNVVAISEKEYKELLEIKDKYIRITQL